jgi:hypothetical protein
LGSTTTNFDGARTGEEVMANIDVPEAVRVWKIGVDQANVLSWNNYTDNGGYHLFCITNGKYLTWEEVPVGINLNFKPEGDNKTHFRLPDEQEREILSGESVALGIGGKPAFLYYKERDVGINLDWSETPKYEWRIFGADSELGKPIPENTPVAILNDKVQPDPDFLINFNRPVGSDIGWTTSPGFWDSFGSIAEKYAADAAKVAVRALL